MTHPPTTPAAAAPTLGLWDAVSIIVGIIIGSTIYKSANHIFYHAGGPGAALGVWVLGGVLSLIGALCYAELAGAYPSAGGDYTFLTRAFGRAAGFAFAWAELAVVRAGGSIGAVAYVFAEYADRLAPLRAVLPGPLAPHATGLYAALAVLTLTLVNAVGARPGARVQNTLTLAKVVGLGCLAAAGLTWWFGPPPGPTGPPQAPIPGYEPSLALALVFVLYAYGGWNEAAYVTSELRDRRTATTRTLVLGVSLVTLIYLLVNAAYLGLGYAAATQLSRSLPADLMSRPLGRAGEWFIEVLVMVSALGAVNGLILTGTRLYGLFGAQHAVFAALRPRRPGAPAYGALAAQAGFSLGLIAAVEFGPVWKPWLLGAASPRDGGSFERLVVSAAPVFWGFFLLTGSSLVVLRLRDPGAERPFRVPLYPLTPLVFCATSAFMLFMSGRYAVSQQPAEAILVGGLLAAGLPLYALSALLGRGRPAGEASSVFTGEK